MCGLAGIYSFDGDSQGKQLLPAMSSLLKHRGPDGEGFWQSNDGEMAFGHRRLSIIDLTETGSQPMQYAGGRYTIIYNGEIYNYIELKEWLTRFNYKFVSSSDTEVLLALYDFKREECFQYIDGMFALAIWDEQEKQLFCARDRFGEKPFYYYRDNTKFLFASEIKSLRTAESSIRPDMEKLRLFINDNNKGMPDESFFLNVHSLPPAHYLIVKKDRFVMKKYWDIDLSKRTRYVRLSQYHEHFYDLLMRSVRRRLRSDVHVGSSLSGGIDSSTIVACICQIRQGDFPTFSARFHHAQDEGQWIEEAVNYLHVKNFQTFPAAEHFQKETGDLLFAHEYPFSSTSIYAQWCVMRLAKEHSIKVLLDGQGADEYLAGYDNLKYFALWELYRSGKLLRFRNEITLMKKNFGAGKSVGFKYMYDPLLQLFGFRRKIYDKGYTLRERLKYAITNELPELLRYADRNSMAHSVEVRLPFLSHQLVEYAFSLPPEQIYQQGRTKYVLREAARQVLPPKIYNRTDKVGFAAPQNEWLNAPGFRDIHIQMEQELKKYGLSAGSDAFRNYIAANFVQIFA